MCPGGCSKLKIEFGNKCRICLNDFMYFVLDMRIITNEDLFGSDDEPSDLWSCKNCNNHNIDIFRVCIKCNRNKY